MNLPLAASSLLRTPGMTTARPLSSPRSPASMTGSGVGEPAVDRRVTDLGAERVDEPRARGTRTQRGDRHAGRTGLGPEGLAEGTSALLAA